MLDVTAAGQESQGVAENGWPFRQGRFAEVPEDPAVPKDVLERLAGKLAGGKERHVGESRRGVDIPVLIQAERIPSGVAEVVLDSPPAVYAPADRLEVVEDDPLLLGGVGRGQQLLDDPVDLREEAVVARSGASTPVWPHQMLRSGAVRSGEGRQLRQLIEVSLGDDGREGDIEPEFGEGP